MLECANRDRNKGAEDIACNAQRGGVFPPVECSPPSGRSATATAAAGRPSCCCA